MSLFWKKIILLKMLLFVFNETLGVAKIKFSDGQASRKSALPGMQRCSKDF